jgi:hypothetical protein
MRPDPKIAQPDEVNTAFDRERDTSLRDAEIIAVVTSALATAPVVGLSVACISGTMGIAEVSTVPTRPSGKKAAAARLVWVRRSFQIRRRTLQGFSWVSA